MIHSSLDGHSGHFQYLTIKNKAAWVLLYVAFSEKKSLIPVEYIPKSGFADAVKIFSKVVKPVFQQYMKIIIAPHPHYTIYHQFLKIVVLPVGMG